MESGSAARKRSLCTSTGNRHERPGNGRFTAPVGQQNTARNPRQFSDRSQPENARSQSEWVVSLEAGQKSRYCCVDCFPEVVRSLRQLLLERLPGHLDWTDLSNVVIEAQVDADRHVADVAGPLVGPWPCRVPPVRWTPGGRESEFLQICVGPLRRRAPEIPTARRVVCVPEGVVPPEGRAVPSAVFRTGSVVERRHVPHPWPPLGQALDSLSPSTRIGFPEIGVEDCPEAVRGSCAEIVADLAPKAADGDSLATALLRLCRGTAEAV